MNVAMEWWKGERLINVAISKSAVSVGSSPRAPIASFIHTHTRPSIPPYLEGDAVEVLLVQPLPRRVVLLQDLGQRVGAELRDDVEVALVVRHAVEADHLMSLVVVVHLCEGKEGRKHERTND